MTDLEVLAGAVGVRRRGGLRRLTWIGESIIDLDDPLAPEALAEVLYTSAYVFGAPTPLASPLDRVPDSGWASIQVDDRIVATWSGWTATGDGTIAQAGMPTINLELPSSLKGNRRVAVPMAASSLDLIPGWCLVQHGDVRYGVGTVRLYANTRPKPVQAIVADLTTVLLDAGLGQFGAKFLCGRDHVDRADSTVIYLPGAPDAELLSRILALMGPTIAGDATPMFTRRLVPGVALAHSPADGASFGQLRCRQVATALVQHLRADGGGLKVPFDETLPWNGPEVGPLDQVLPPKLKPTACPRAVDPECALHAIADGLTRTAITADRRATWLTRDRLSGRMVAAGSAIYEGAAGPVAVLAQANRLDGGQRHLPLLRAAARAMLDRQDEIPLSGFHSGQAGTAAALAEAADLVQDEELAEIARDSLDRACRPRKASRDWDLFSGTAGTILGISAAANYLNVDVAEGIQHWTEQLVARGEDDALSGGIRWRSHVGRRRPALAGLAHGGSGAALALATASSPNRDLAPMASRCVDFEDNRRRSDEGWLDHRNPAIKRAAVAWCHGAGGIGLASAALDRYWPGIYRPRARLAAKHLALSLTGPNYGRGLCHGRSGRALALAVVANHLGDEALIAKAKFDLSEMDELQENLDLSLMNGEPGVALARLVGAGLARAPIAFVVDRHLQ